MPDPLYLDKIKSKLTTNSIGCKVHLFHEIDSTNNKAKELAIDKAIHGTLVLADHQTAGRGRMEKKWVSPESAGVCMSVILRPDDVCHQSLFTIIAGIATVHAIKTLTNLDVSIKWPNDVLLDKKKLAGVLSEASYRNGKLEYIIIGIGLNVHIERKQFPVEIKDIATSLTIAGVKKISRCDIIASICKEFEFLYSILKQGRLKYIKNEWTKHAGMLGQYISVISGDVCVKGKALSISEEGMLLVETKTGEVIKVAAGEIL